LNLFQDSEQDVPHPFSFGPLPPSPSVSSPSPAMERIVEVTEENTSSTENDSVPKTEVEVLEYKGKTQDIRQEKDNTKLEIKKEPPKCLPEDLSRDINKLKAKVKHKERDEENVKSKDEVRRRKHEKEQVKELTIGKKDEKDKKKEHEDKKPHMNGGVKKHQRERKEKQKEPREDGKPNVPVKEKRERKEKKSSKKSERKSRKERAEKEAEESMSLVEEEELERARSRSREVGERLARHEHQCSHSGALVSTHTIHNEDLDEVLSNKSSACDCPAHVHDRESPLQIAEVRDAVRVSRTLKNSEPSRFNF